MHNERKIKNAYKKAMFANHPDKGGSKFIALKLSEARDYLLTTLDSSKNKEQEGRKEEEKPADAKKEGEKGDAKGDAKKGGSKRR